MAGQCYTIGNPHNALSYTALFTIFHKLELYMAEKIKIIENLCNDCLVNIHDKINNGAFLNDDEAPPKQTP